MILEKLFLFFVLIFFSLAAGFLVYALGDLATDGKATEPFRRFKDRNKLFECKRCGKLFRLYQWEIVNKAKQSPECPHCETRQNIYKGYGLSGLKEIKKPDKWMNIHPDCPKIGISSFVKFSRAIKSVEKIKKEEAMIKRFEKYNNLKADADWIIKLQKDLKG